MRPVHLLLLALAAVDGVIAALTNGATRENNIGLAVIFFGAGIWSLLRQHIGPRPRPMAGFITFWSAGALLGLSGLVDGAVTNHLSIILLGALVFVCSCLLLVAGHRTAAKQRSGK